MAEYIELVKELRELAAIPAHCENIATCDECTKEDICMSFTNERIIRTAGSAADAIEQLSTYSELYKELTGKGIKCIRELLDKFPKWIPVTERLPEKRKYVLVRYKNNDMAVACWFDGDEDILFWRAMTDEGWCADCDTDPTHWMPLPTPPKEETE